MRRDVTLYSRHGCHLCDVALELLRQLNIEPRVIDIDENPQWREQFHEWVPVIEIDGRVRFRGIINEHLLIRELTSVRPNDT